MTKVKLGGNFNEVPDSKPAPAGLFIGKIQSIEEKNSKNNDEGMVEVQWVLVKDDEGKKLGKDQQYDPIYSYAPTDPESSWARRMKELLKATGSKMTGTVDIKVGTECLLKLKEGTNQEGDPRPNISKIMKVGEVADEEAEAESEDDEEEDDDANGAVDLDEMDRAAMKEFIKAKELGIRVLKKDDDDALREKIRAAMPEDDEDEDEDEDEDDEDEGVDLDELDRAGLKALIKENGLDITVKKAWSDDDIREKIKEVAGADADDEDEDEDEDEDDAPSDNYDELDLKTLQGEAKTRELKTDGSKKALIARLRKDDAEDPV